jgi:hypothetical protein
MSPPPLGIRLVIGAGLLIVGLLAGHLLLNPPKPICGIAPTSIAQARSTPAPPARALP